MEIGFIEVMLAFIIIFAVVFIIILLFFFNRPYNCNRKIEGDKTIFTLDAKKDIANVEVLGKFGKEKIKFQRKDIKKGEKIEFIYPASTEPASVTVEIEKGNQKTFEV
jgi:hypothetical protein